jgi:NitT/TauT family transport system ATP-binding protein
MPENTNKQPKIVAEGVNKIFNRGLPDEVIAVQNLNLETQEGEFVALLGPSGCGKSTFLYMVAGFEEITSGRLTLDGEPITGPSPNRGIVFQEYVLFPWQTVRRNIEFGLRIQKAPAEVRKERVEKLVRLIGLQGFEDTYPHLLSGGMQQRVSIARALAYDPDVLLMDEPFGALDAQTRSRMIRDVSDLHVRTHKTILFVTHSVEESILLADRICLFSARPASVKEVITVEIERPRSVTDPKFMEYAKYLLASLEEEVAKTMELNTGQ